MHIILTYYSDGSGEPQVHLARNGHDMARIFLHLEGYGKSYRIFEIPERGGLQEMTLGPSDPMPMEVADA